jgi:sugar O-acyltransferase (sialic acid O-acetyltransferase NeuD family)
MTTLLGVYGAGGCGRGILPLVRASSLVDEECVFVDDNGSAQSINGARRLTFAQFAEHRGERRICLAVANGRVRQVLDDRCRGAGIDFLTARASEHVEMDDVQIGEGALISPYTVVTSNVRIGRHFHLNLYSYVEHDCVIGDFVTFAPSVRCNGNVHIGDGAYIGSGAVIRQGLKVGAGATIGMGAVVTKNVPAGETWIGNPARRM